MNQNQRKRLETHLIRQMQANGGILKIDLEYTSYELRQQLEYMEQRGVVVSQATTSFTITYRLKTFDSTLSTPPKTTENDQ